LAPQFNSAWNVVTGICIVFFVGVVAALLAFAIKFRRRRANEVGSTNDHNTQIEIVWTAIPTLLVLGLFVIGVRGYLNAAVAPGNAMEINVTAEKWLWTFTYPTGLTTVNELRVPKDRPVRLVMSAKDVLHGLYIPEFRIKQDVVPGSYTSVWFEATEAKETTILCTEYCGTGHSDMLAKVVVMEPAKFKEWLESGGGDDKRPPAEIGKELYTSRSCVTCHSLDGSRIQGPSFKGIFGRQEQFADGTAGVVDENYIRQSILNPQAKLVAGYPPVMPTYQGLLNDKQIDALIAFLKTVK
jgi:cytochrome c oxidase subunit 2